MTKIYNSAGQSFQLDIYGNIPDEDGQPIPWWYQSRVIVKFTDQEVSTELELLTTEDLHLLEGWLKQIYEGNTAEPIFQFVDGHVWFKLWKKCNKLVLRFFIQVDEKTKYFWDWDYKKDENQVFLGYVKKLLEN
jgi:hypothetical protein